MTAHFVIVFLLLSAVGAGHSEREPQWLARRMSSDLQIDADGCGLRPLLPNDGVSQLTYRIVGGHEAVPNSWPAICSLRLADYPDSHKCGASLIRNLTGHYFLLTAGHCVNDDPRFNQYIAHCGVHDWSVAMETHRVVLNFTDLVLHRNFNHITLDYDVAIFSLLDQPPTNNYVSAVCLPNEDWFVGETSIVVGWGSLQPTSAMSSTLQQVLAPIMSVSSCQENYGANSITPRMFCAGNIQGGIDACEGDSGGPLYTYRNNRWTLTGVVSWGWGCADPGYPGVYADVMRYKYWIDSVINL